ncbi:hypothetical protein OC842_006698 [Tilletia horrida]|uniref:Uncharacterized protein n=1 Tax=Tilletia horrida TaxID=155126 RepID=A0AAN6G7P9_9BASI|nr:hypothetical protein OC842_006698 [Tilletia horrida]
MTHTNWLLLFAWLAALAHFCLADPSPDFPYANAPPLPRVTSPPSLWGDLQIRGSEELGENHLQLYEQRQEQPQERQLTLTPGARPTPIYVPLADPKDTYSACFWGIGNAGQTVYKVFETAPTGEEWEAYLLSGPLGVSLYHDRLTTRVNGSLETVIASATCKYDQPREGNVATADCNWMAMIDPPATSWYRYTTALTATYTPDLCQLQHNTKTSWDIGSGNGSFDPNPDSVPQSWAVRRMEYWAMTSIWAVGMIGCLAIIGLRVL